jgi:valyl-tRNA synthetase
MELAKAYDAQSIQKEVTETWDAEKLWHAEPDERPREKRFSIVIPPPNVTGALHLGHAINNTLQDILIRYHRMLGDNTVWLPGTDHAGIATQTVVDKRLQAEGKPALKEYKQLEAKGENGREQFLKKVGEWKTEYEARILGQLRAMGCSCDWDRTAFTMDEQRSKAVREAFFQLFKAGLIYRGKRLVNWDPVTQTALADDEVEMEEIDGSFFYLKYPVCDADGTLLNAQGLPSLGLAEAQSVTVATTRPETMLGDTAVAINPKDPRAASLRGKFVKLPIVDRIIPIIEDEYVVLPVAHGGDENDVKAKFSSGFLKVTPAHDPNDYLLGQKYSLAMINVMAPDASISLDHGWGALEPDQKNNETLKPFLGCSRELARASVVDYFKKNNLLEKIVPYRHSVGHSYRSHAPIEPYLSDQWYCKVTDPRMAGAANASLAADQRSESGTGLRHVSEENHVPEAHAAGEGLRFFPERHAKTFESWHNNIRDWCISRQLWWGHRIPVWAKQTGSASETFLGGARTQSGTLSILQTKEGDEIRDGERVIGFARGLVDLGNGNGMHVICLRENDSAIAAELEKIDYVQDPDVLDTWFSSALWPLSTLGWPDDSGAQLSTPDPQLSTVDYWNPTSVLATGRDIVTLWVSRMVMFNQFLKGCLPFEAVYINPTIQDGQGQRMSKSLGNGVDPIDIIESHGADAMRFTLASMATQTQDVKLPVELIDPHTGETFEPKFITNNAGYVVAAPIQEHKGKKCISSYGAASGAAKPTPDMPVAKNTSSKFDLGRFFCNKLWNAGRFVLMQLSSSGTGLRHVSEEAHVPEAHATADESKWSTIDRWILSRLARTVQSCNEAINSFRFDNYAKAAYDFVWRDFCDWYLEASKPAMKDPARRVETARILATCFDTSLRLMHPMIPFITEKLWWALNDTNAPRGIDDRFPCEGSATASQLSSNGSHAATKSLISSRIMTAPYPFFTERMDTLTSGGAERVVERLQEIVGAIRNVRNDNKVDQKKRVSVTLHCEVNLCHHLEGNREFIEGLALCTLDAVGPDAIEPPNAAKTTAAGVTIYVVGVIDAASSEKRKAELTKQIAAMKGRLSNESYVAKAPPKLVQETKDQLAAAEAELAKL